MKVLCEQENNSPGIKFKKQYTRRHEAKLLLYTKVHHDTNKWLKKNTNYIFNRGILPRIYKEEQQ